MHTKGRGRAQITQQGAYSRGQKMGRTFWARSYTNNSTKGVFRGDTKVGCTLRRAQLDTRFQV